MSTIPFYRYVVTLLLLNNNIAKIQDTLRKFGFSISNSDIEGVLDHISKVPIESIKKLLDKGLPFEFDNKQHVEYLNHIGVYEMYEYFARTLTLFDEEPNYFKWIRDCEWVLKHEDVSILVDTFIFNGEPTESISAIIKFKYGRFIPVQAIDLYVRYFFDTSGLSAKEVFKFFPFMRESSAVIRKLHNGETEIEFSNGSKPELHNGFSPNINIVDSNYLKWKIGYRDVVIPSAKSFLQTVQMDAMCKFYESMNMTHSVEVEEEEGEAGGSTINIVRKKRRNTEEQKAKMAKQWLDIYIKATDKIPTDDGEADNFFDKVKQISLEFRDYDTEKIASVKDVAGMLDDIKGDM